MASDDGKGAQDAERAVSLLRHVFDVLEFQIRQSPQLAREILAFGTPPAAKPVPAEPKAPKQPPKAKPAPPEPAPPALDPFRVYEDGWEVLLRSQLEPLDAKQLAAIIDAFALDPKGRVAGRKVEVLREWIVVAVIEKADGSL